jgi:hypothetical protein
MPILATDPIDWELNDDFQLIIPIRYVSGLKAVRQAARIRIKMAAGEWFLNLGIGVPWLPTPDGVVTDQQAILGDAPFDEAKAVNAIRLELLTIPALIEVTDIRATFDNAERRMAVVWSARTQFGDISVDTVDLELAA